MSCCLGGTDQRQTCFAGTSEARLDGVAESVALQGVMRVCKFGEVHAVYASSDMGMSPAGTNRFTRDLRSMRANMSWQATFALVMLPRSASACPASIPAYKTPKNACMTPAKDALTLPTRTDAYQKTPAITKKCTDMATP